MINQRVFNEIDSKMRDRIIYIDFPGYTSYYNQSKLTGIFKISDKFRNTLEGVLLDYTN